jgi:hypothetical protein
MTLLFGLLVILLSVVLAIAGLLLVRRLLPSTFFESKSEASYTSENGNHASIYTTGTTAEEADAKLIGALRELKLVPQKATKDQR